MDETRRESIKPLIHAWMQERLRSLQDQVLLTWEEGMGRLRPDDALLQKILDLAEPEEPVAPPVPSDQSIECERCLGVALDLLERANNQGEVLRHLLEGLRPFAERSAIFVVKPGAVALYAQRGFEVDVSRRSLPVVSTPELEDLIQGRLKSIVRHGTAYKALLEPLSGFEAPEICILPLCLRRKPVGVLLVDSGLEQRLDTRQTVRALTRATEAALSFQAASREERNVQAPSVVQAPAAPVMQSAPVVVASALQPVPMVAVPPSLMKQPPFAAAPPVVQAPNVNCIPLPDHAPVAGLDPKLRANAERSARVLIGDIELYSPAKVASGRTQKNLYAQLKDELERSRASFVDRYGNEVEEQYHIFYNTLVQQLCDGDPLRLGPHPWAKITTR